MNRRTAVRAQATPIAAAEARAFALVSLLSVLGLALIVGAGAVWLSAP